MINGVNVETKSATAILVEDRYVGCYYNVPVQGVVNLRAFNRKGETSLFTSFIDLYRWLGAVKLADTMEAAK